MRKIGQVLACPACGFVPGPKPKITEREGCTAAPKTQVYEQVERDNRLGIPTAIAAKVRVA